MQNKRAFKILLVIMFVVLGLKIFLSLQSPHFSSDEAYYHLRHVNFILNNKIPMTYDDLSYSGRNSQFTPVYHYLLALPSLIFPTILVAKIFPAILAMLTSIIIYFIAFELTKDKTSALFSALFSMFIPIFISKTLNSSSVYSFVIPLFFLMIFCLIKLREERTYLVYFVFLSILFPLTHPSSFLLLLSLLLYVLMLVSENMAIRKTIKEAAIFSALTILLINFLIFKEAFLTFGISALWQNANPTISSGFLANLSFTQIVYSMGVISSVLGILAIFLIFFTSRKDSHILMIGVILATLVAMLSRTLAPSDGLIFLAISLTILSSITLSKLGNYLDISKIAHRKNIIMYSIVSLTLLLSITPSISASFEVMDNVPKDIDVEALLWIGKNIEERIVIAALPEEGNLIAYTTKKPNVIDEYYFMAPSPIERYTDLARLYETKSEFEAIDISKKYDIGIIFVSERAKSKYKITGLVYDPSEENCFVRRKYEDISKIYQVRKC